MAENVVAKLLGNFYSRFLSGVISMIISCKLTNLDIFFYLRADWKGEGKIILDTSSVRGATAVMS